MRPKWTKAGSTQKDLFEIIDAFIYGESIHDIVTSDNHITENDIRELLLRTSMYLKSHLILDSYNETVNQIKLQDAHEIKLEWTANETKELVNLHISGASIITIADLMRKDNKMIEDKLRALNLLHER